MVETLVGAIKRQITENEEVVEALKKSKAKEAGVKASCLGIAIMNIEMQNNSLKNKIQMSERLCCQSETLY